MSLFWQRFYIVSLISTFPFIAQTTLFDRLMKFISRYTLIIHNQPPIMYYSPFISFFQLQSLGLLGSIPAAALIFSLFCLLLYLMSRCCDRKPRPAHSITSLKVTLSIVTVLCCGAIGLGEFKSSIKISSFSFFFFFHIRIDTHSIELFSLIRIALFFLITPPSTSSSSTLFFVWIMLMKIFFL